MDCICMWSSQNIYLIPEITANDRNLKRCTSSWGTINIYFIFHHLDMFYNRVILLATFSAVSNRLVGGNAPSFFAIVAIKVWTKPNMPNMPNISPFKPPMFCIFPIFRSNFNPPILLRRGVSAYQPYTEWNEEGSKGESPRSKIKLKFCRGTVRRRS